ncbi:MAG: ATP-binding protein [Sterolibacterium sp.]
MKLNRKIILLTISILLVSLFISSAVNIVNFRKNYTEALITGSYGLGQSLNSVLTEMLNLGLPLESLTGMNKKLRQVIENNLYISYVGIADMTGKGIFHTTPGRVGYVATDEAMRRSLATSVPITQTYLRDDGHEYFDVTIPVFDARKEHAGVIRLGFRTEVVDDKVKQAVAEVALNFVITFIVIAVLINILLARLISTPLVALSAQAGRIAAGDFASEVHINRQDEIGQLSDALNRMSRTILSQLEALQHARSELEQQVEARTHELALTNRQLEQRNLEMQAKTEALLRSNADLDQFAYSVSHDMRQPLRMISGHLQLLQKGLQEQLDENNRENLTYALDGARRMDQMIVSLLEYSRVGRKTEGKEWMESRTSLDEALDFLAPAIEEAQASIEIGGVWPRVYASRDEMTRLLQNLVGNAAHYHEPATPPRIEVNSLVTENVWRVSVRDHGIGIDPSQIDRLFHFFSRLQSRERFAGTGMGLALCRRIVEHHGGRIWAESAGAGQGSEFVFEIPVNVDKEQAA